MIDFFTRAICFECGHQRDMGTIISCLISSHFISTKFSVTYSESIIDFGKANKAEGMSKANVYKTIKILEQEGLYEKKQINL